MSSDVCCTPAPPAEHIDEGTKVTIGGVKCYVNNPSRSKAAVILVSDLFGVEGPLVRKFVDDVASSGFYAICPDFFHGNPFVPKNMANPFLDLAPWLAVHHPVACLPSASMTAELSGLPPFKSGRMQPYSKVHVEELQTPSMDASIDDCTSIIKELKAEEVQSIGLTGCCWGGRLCVMIGKEDDLATAIVLLHPSLTTKETIKDLKVATAFLSAEIDDHTTAAMVQEFKEILDTKPIPSLVKIFPGQKHGWTIRYDVNDPHQVKGAEEAHADMVEFYKSVLL